MFRCQFVELPSASYQTLTLLMEAKVNGSNVTYDTQDLLLSRLTSLLSNSMLNVVVAPWKNEFDDRMLRCTYPCGARLFFNDNLGSFNKFCADENWIFFMGSLTISIRDHSDQNRNQVLFLRRL